MAQALTDIRAQLEADRQSMKGQLPAVSGRKVSTRGKVFTFPDGASGQGPIKAVILDFRNFYKYYTKPYNPQQPSGPDCYALSRLGANEITPSDRVEDPMAENCRDCAMNQWGSAPQGGKGKACRNMARLAILRPDAGPNDDAFIIEVSPTGLKSWAAFANHVDALGKHIAEIVAEIGFDPNQAYPSLVFKALQPHDKLELVWAARERAQAILDAPPAAGD